ncbi:MAG: hypothetical protein ABI193_04665 [Minicystis sp.]
MNRGLFLPLVALALAGLSCSDLDHFSSGEGDAYCGAITLGGTFRAGFSPRVQMRLRIDASRLDGPGGAGTLSTFEAADSARPERRLLDKAVLQRIPALENDPLSQLDFGEGRLRSVIFGVTPNDPAVRAASGAADAVPSESILAILSFLNDDRVEVRLLRPGVVSPSSEPVPDGRRPLFGVFPLSRQVGQCGF